MGVIKVALPPEDKNILVKSFGYMWFTMKGMIFTLTTMIKQMLGLEKNETLEWPEQPATYGERFKGKHFLTRRDDGQVRCTACFLCATNCPADCIHIEAGQHPDNDIEKFPIRFEIDILRCVFCGYCEEACPVDAIRLGPEFAMTNTDGAKWVYTKDYLTARETLSNEGIDSVKPENDKHSSVETKVLTGKEYHTEIAHGDHS